MSNGVQLNLSTRPLHCGWYGVVLVLRMFNSLQTSVSRAGVPGLNVTASLLSISEILHLLVY